jgi:DNA polymerase-3 subunit delta'
MVSLFSTEDEEPEESTARGAKAAPPAAVPEPEELTPRNNTELVGHERAENLLLADFNAGRLPHAIILSGAPGIGKATLAYRLARFLLAQTEQAAGLFGEPEKPGSLHIAPENPTARRVASGGHADLIVVEREFDEKKGKLKQDISAESVRKITPFLRKTAAEGGWRVVVVDGADYLNRTSQNALLKILEEPPPKTALLLVTSQAGAFLPTIRSRCRSITLGSLSDPVVTVLLDKFAPGLDGAERAALVRLGEGSIGRALQFHADKGVALYKDLLAVVSPLPALDVVKAHDLADKYARAEKSFEAARDILTGWCLKLARAEARNAPLTDVLPGDAAVFAKIAQAYPPRHFMTAWERMSQLFTQAETAILDRRQTLLGALLILQKPESAVLQA